LQKHHNLVLHWRLGFELPKIARCPATAELAPIDLADCSEAFLENEKLSENDTWYCPNCKEHRRAFKKFDVWKLPDQLVIQLKRFEYTNISREKIGALVNFPIDTLDLSRYVAGSEGSGAIYDLYAVSNHFGGLGGGHYTAHAQNPSGQWYHFDDSHVTKVTDLSKLKSSAAYILFYRRRPCHLASASNIDTNASTVEVNDTDHSMADAALKA
jgi:ubiquitin carboxyl-terminal hydrolase 4/11/15